MLCERCKKREATVHITHVVNGKKKEMHLCSICANELGGEGDFVDLSLPKLLGSIFPTKVGFDELVSDIDEPKCDVCGMSLSYFKQNGKLGCANCYSVFRPTLKKLLRQIHGTARHTGRKPKNFCLVDEDKDRTKSLSKADRKSVLSIDEKIALLRKELKEAVKREEYEKAAELRDRIRELQKEGR